MYTTINAIAKQHKIKWYYVKGCCLGLQVELHPFSTTFCVDENVSEMVRRCSAGLAPIEGMAPVINEELVEHGNVVCIAEIAKQIKQHWYFVKGAVDGLQVPKYQIGRQVCVDHAVMHMIERMVLGYTPVVDMRPQSEFEKRAMPFMGFPWLAHKFAKE